VVVCGYWGPLFCVGFLEGVFFLCLGVVFVGGVVFFFFGGGGGGGHDAASVRDWSLEFRESIVISSSRIYPVMHRE